VVGYSKAPVAGVLGRDRALIAGFLIGVLIVMAKNAISA
jgi:hypothetical protein